MERFRGRRGWPFLLFWVLWSGLVATLLVWMAQEITNQGFGQVFFTRQMGRFLFDSGALLLVTAVVFLVPGIAALSIVSERERQTLHLLQITLLSARQLVLGKLVASLAYFGLLVVAVLPILSVPLLFGGVPFGDLVGAAFMTGAIGVLIGSISIWVSSWAKSSRAAVAVSYLLTFLIAFFTILLIGGELFLQTDRFNRSPKGEIWMAIANPYMALVSAVEQPLEFKQFNNWVTPFVPAYLALLSREQVGEHERPPDRVFEKDNRFFVKQRRVPLWILSTVFYGGISYWALSRAARNVRAPGPRLLKVRRVKTSG